MIANIVRASRQILSQQSGSSSQSATDRVYSGHPQRRPVSANARNFHLDLKPVYRTKWTQQDGMRYSIAYLYFV